MGFMSWIKKRVTGTQQFAFSQMFTPSTGKAVWSGRNWGVYAKETYMKNWTAYKSIDLISKSVASVPWGVFEETDEGRELVPNHPLNEMLSISRTRVNRNETFSILNKKAVSYLCMTGNAFLRKMAPNTGPNKGVPKMLEIMRPDRMKIYTDELGRVTNYEYRVTSGNSYLMGGVPEGSSFDLATRVYNFEVDPETGDSEVMHIKMFHPLDDYWGAAPSESAARNIDTANEMAEWNKKLLDNECRPGMIITVNGRLTDEQYDRMKTDLNQKYSGFENAGRNLLLEGGDNVKAEPYGFSPADIDFLDGSREEARKIANVYGVPPMLLGIPGDNTYSNQKEARQAFWEETVIFYLGLLRDSYNWWLLGNDNKYFIDYDLDQVSALEEKREMKWKRANESTFLTINEKREMVGKEKIDGGDVILVPATSSSLEGVSAPVELPETEEEEQQEEELVKAQLLGKVNEARILSLIGDEGR